MSTAATPVAPDPAIAMLRHTVATLAYRAAKPLRGAPPHFASFQFAPDTRTPVQILAHMGDLFDWAVALADGAHVWREATPLPWDEEVTRFFAALTTFDQRLASGGPLRCEPERLFQGPIADALTHLGQISMFRRMAGAPVRGENYYKATITTGRTGVDQTPPAVEFN